MNSFKKLAVLLPALFIVSQVWAGKSIEIKALNAAEREWQISAFTTIKDIIEADSAYLGKTPISKSVSSGYKYEITQDEKERIDLGDIRTKRSALRKTKKSQHQQEQAKSEQRQRETWSVEQDIMHQNVTLWLLNRLEILRRKQETGEKFNPKQIHRVTNREFIKAVNAALIKIELLGSYSEKYSVSLVTPSEAASIRLNVIHDLFNKFYNIKNLRILSPRYTTKLLSSKKIKPVYNDKLVTRTVLKHYKPLYYAKIEKMKFFNTKLGDFRRSNVVRLTLASDPLFYTKNSLWLDKYLKIVALHNKIYPAANQYWGALDASISFEKYKQSQTTYDEKKLREREKNVYKDVEKSANELERRIKTASLDHKPSEIIEELIASGRHMLNTHGRNTQTASLNRLYNNCLLICFNFYKEYKEKEISAQTTEIEITELEAIDKYCQRSKLQLQRLDFKKFEVNIKNNTDAIIPEISKLKTQAYKNLAYVESVKTALFKLDLVKFRMQELIKKFNPETDYNYTILNVYLHPKNFKDQINDPVLSRIYDGFFPTEQAKPAAVKPEFAPEPKVKTDVITKYSDKEITNIIKSVIQSCQDLPKILVPRAVSITTKLVRRTDARWFWDLLGGETETYSSTLINKYSTMMSGESKNQTLLAGWVLAHIENVPPYSSDNMREWVIHFIKTTTINKIR